MNRISASMSLIFAVALAGTAGCSGNSESNKGGSGGGGASAAGSSSSGGGSAGTNANAGGATGGSSSPAGGNSTTGGMSSGACSGPTTSCVDATSITACNTDTGKMETVNCVDYGKTIGFVSSGCMKDAAGDHCAIDSVSDQACADGASALAFCENKTDDETLFNVYVNCFQDNMMAHSIVTCFNQYVTPTMNTDADCNAAAANCFPDEGAGGAQGAGGAP